jgi:hypothetical protein
MRKPPKNNIDEEDITRVSSRSGNGSNDVAMDEKKSYDPSFTGREVPIAVVEQRVSNLAQGALCLVLLTSPFLHILGFVPRGVLAGLL